VNIARRKTLKTLKTFVPITFKNSGSGFNQHPSTQAADEAVLINVKKKKKSKKFPLITFEKAKYV
jgi:hypothetical protein